LGAEIERHHGDPDFQFSRLTIDLWRLPTFIPISVTTNLVREGGRIKVVDAEAFAGGVSIGRASGVLLRRGEQPDGEVWRPEPWDMPPPLSIEPEKPRTDLPDGWQPLWETRSLGLSFGTAARKRVWMREVRTLVKGQPLTPFQRIALAVDYVNPLSNSGSAGLGFINVDITLYLHRLPAGEWIGFDVTDHDSSAGVSTGSCRIYDEEGGIGLGVVAGLAQRRKIG
jgi:hypothetical protein